MFKRPLRVSLLHELILFMSMVIMLTAFLLTYLFVRNQADLVRNSLYERCGFLTRNLAANSEFGVSTRNINVLSKLAQRTLNEEDVAFVTIYDRNWKILATARKTGEESPDLASRKSTEKSFFPPDIFRIYRVLPFLSSSSYNETFDDALFPVVIHHFPKTMERWTDIPQEEIIGFANVGISLERMQHKIEILKRKALVSTLIAIIIGIILATVLTRLIIHPIQELVTGTRKIAQGHLDYRVNVESVDEIADLSRSFNSMAEDLMRHVLDTDRERAHLTQLKVQLEERTQQLEDTLLKMKNIQQELLRSEKFAVVGRLAASVAHELRNPLASLKNISYYLLKLDAISDPKARHMLEMLSTDVNRANKIVTDLLDYSRVKRLTKVPVAMDEFMNKLIDHLHLGENITIQRNFEAMTATIDPDRMTQVLVNLLTNARDAMPEGGTVTATVCKAGEAVEISIQDTGSGMTKDTLERVFEPLFTTKTKGMGLGLAIVKEIIDAHFGKIAVCSEKDKGTTFRITLPLT